MLSTMIISQIQIRDHCVNTHLLSEQIASLCHQLPVPIDRLFVEHCPCARYYLDYGFLVHTAISHTPTITLTTPKPRYHSESKDYGYP